MKPNSGKPDGTGQGIFGLSRGERVALLLIFVVGLIYVVWKLATPLQVQVNLGEDIPSPGGGIVIQVEGAVVSPGLIYVPRGATVLDAIEAAGGFTPQADRSELELEAAVVDGERVYVPYEGASGSSRTGRAGIEFERVENPPLGGSSIPVEIPSGLVNINEANQYELQSLPGIGEGLAQRIIAYRMVNGRYGSIEEIMGVEGIGEGKFEDIRNLITTGN